MGCLLKTVALHVPCDWFQPPCPVSSSVSTADFLCWSSVSASVSASVSVSVCCRRLVLLDAYALLYRSHFGMKDVRLSTKTGEDTSILFAFLRVLLDLLELEPPPTHFAIVFDAAGSTFRY